MHRGATTAVGAILLTAPGVCAADEPEAGAVANSLTEQENTNE